MNHSTKRSYTVPGFLNFWRLDLSLDRNRRKEMIALFSGVILK